MKITVLGDGAWGTAAALLLLGNRHDVTLWGPFPDYVAQMQASRVNERFLKGVPLPPALGLTADLAEAVGAAELLVQAIPTPYVRSVLTQVAALGGIADRPLVNLAKGIEVGTLKRLSELCTEVLGPVNYAVISGPSYAEEVVRRVPTAVVVASRRAETALLVQRTFKNAQFRIYTSDDVVGVELGGALKNVLAIAAGICDGMSLGNNAKAALLTRGMVEMARLGQALGGRADTFAGLSGIGDLILTCTSGGSRNRFVGVELGKGRSLDDIVQGMGMIVAEGVKTTQSAWELARRVGAKTPIISEVHATLYGGKAPRQALHDLMTREPRPERD